MINHGECYELCQVPRGATLDTIGFDALWLIGGGFMDAMSGWLSVRVRSLVPMAIGLTLLIGCTPPPPLVVNPQEGWEAAAERGMLRPDVIAASPTPQVEKWVSSEPRVPPKKDEDATVGSVLADIIGYPFRAVAYLAHVLL